MPIEPKIVSFQDNGRSRVPVGRKIAPEALNRFARNQYKGVSPDTLSAVLSKAERGDVEQLADLVSFALRTDPHLRSVQETRVQAIAGSEFRVTPGQAMDMDDVAEAAADFCFQELMSFDGWENLVASLLHAELLGWAGAEHDWFRRDNEWHSAPKVIPPRQLEFADDFGLRVETFMNDAGGKWLDVRNENPNRFILHVPKKFETPNLAGDFHAIAWPWLFKRWVEVFRHNGLERFGNPLMFVTVPSNATDTARDNAESGLQNLSADHIAIFEEETLPQILEMAELPGEAWNEAKKSLNDDISKGLLGSTLNVEVGDTGGNRSLGESQFDTTILPRLKAHSRRLAGTIERAWFAPLLRFNAVRFGGIVPPVPRLEFMLVNEEPPEIDELVVNSGVVTRDELRQARGLEPLGPERGGDIFITPIAKTAPQDVQPAATPDQDAEMAMEDEKRPPLQMALPWTSRTSQTPSALTMRVKAALSSLSEDPES